MDNTTQLIFLTAGAAFVLVVSLWFIGIVVWQAFAGARKQKIVQRLGYARGEAPDDARIIKLWHDGKVQETLVSGTNRRGFFGRRIHQMRGMFGFEVSTATFVAGLFGAACLTLVIAYAFSGDWVVGFAAVAATLFIVDLLAEKHAKRIEALFDRQLCDALSLATRSLRAGHPLLSAFQLIVDEMDAPISDVFSEIVQKQALGKSLEDAILSTAEHHENADLRLFAAAVTVQIRSGGNVADMMDRLVVVIRDRIRLQRRVRVLTSQAQFSKKVLTVIPILLFIFIYVSNPDYLEPLLTTSVGHTLLLLAGIGLFLGWWIMGRIAQLKY